MIRRPLALLLVLSTLSLAACPPRPQPSLDGSVTPSAWTDTARVVIDALAWAIPAVRVVLSAVLPEPARTTVDRVLDGVQDWAGRLQVALDAYQARGGDRCAAHAAAGGLSIALQQLAQVLADNGVALGRPLERVVDSVAALVDVLVPACAPDAGLASAGDAVNAGLRAIETRAAAQGVILRRDLDALRPPSR